MGKSFYEVSESNVSFVTDGAVFDVLSGASLNLTGSSDQIYLESGAGQLKISGDKNTISSSDSGTNVRINSGTGNSVTVGDNGFVLDLGTGNTITTGAGGSVFTNGNAKVYATQGGTYISVMGSDGSSLIYANNDTIDLDGSATVNGNGNHISEGSNVTLTLAGANNVVGMGNGTQVKLSDKDYLTDTNDGTIILHGNITASGATLTGGVLSVQLGNGNVATFSNIVSGSQIEYIDDKNNATWYTLQDTGLTPLRSAMLGASQTTSQLVSAMAGYNADAGAATTASANQSSNDTMFQQTLVAA
jgi:trimeric autotransporter adhesin